MKIAVVVFPGSNCDIDMYEAFHTVCKDDVEYVFLQRKELGWLRCSCFARWFFLR